MEKLRPSSSAASNDMGTPLVRALVQGARTGAKGIPLSIRRNLYPPYCRFEVFSDIRRL